MVRNGISDKWTGLGGHRCGNTEALRLIAPGEGAKETVLHNVFFQL